MWRLTVEVKIKITYDNFSENDLSAIFTEAFTNLGVKCGEQIPKDMFNVREEVLKILFKKEVR